MEKSELLQLQTNANQQDNSTSSKSETITREPIEGTPFYITGQEGKGYFLTLGKYRITKEFETPGDAANQLHDDMWNVIFHMTAAIIEINQHNYKDTNKSKEPIRHERI